MCAHVESGLLLTSSFAYSMNAYPRGFPFIGPALWKRKSSLVIFPNLEKACTRACLFDVLLGSETAKRLARTRPQTDGGFQHKSCHEEVLVQMVYFLEVQLRSLS